MLYPEIVIQKELMWEYNYTNSQAKSIVKNYKLQNRYSELCDLITYKMSLANSKDNLLIRYQG